MLDLADVFYMKSFHDLSTCRSTGMGLGPIPWTAIIGYANHYGLEKDIAEAFVDIIREMDSSYISYNAEETKRKDQLNKSKGKKHG